MLGLRAAGVTVDERRVAELRGPDSTLTAVANAVAAGSSAAAMIVHDFMAEAHGPTPIGAGPD